MCAAAEASDFSHNIYKNDPILYKSYVGSHVEVTTENGETCSGIVYTVDPVSESVVLVEVGQVMNLKVILGHAVKNIQVLRKEEYEFPGLFPVNSFSIQKLTQSACEHRKALVKEFFVANRFPITEDGEVLLIEDVVAINPPYTVENCVSTNSIVLSRVQTLLERINV